jgi:aminoglycoside phosphotransferase (APT) family kinase protein
MSSGAPPDDALRTFVEALALAPAGAAQAWLPLSGGVSCQAWRVDVGARRLCVKRALARLAVERDWRAPIGRAVFEYRWFETARSIIAKAAPEPLGVDGERGFIAMEFLDAAEHPLWKAQLLAGSVNLATATDVGARIAAIHSGTAGRQDIAERFDTEAIFFALRLEPYLLAAGERRPAVAPALRTLVERTARTRLALVHGDVSPKNILVGPTGPVFLDAETAWYGDPAFDLAFCLNHLLLKCLVVPGAIAPLLRSFEALAGAYLERVDWESPRVLETRAASLLPGLLLARVDGKSPVEYLTDPAQKDFVRRAAEPLLLAPPTTLADVQSAWRRALLAANATSDPS